ncbi:ABC transporter substrate-binding protein [Kineosporia babensis]|uniref:ABC transporter substrate-binding protein n=1 Tax=Kineosporia babensis TaxID=499548 RepID=A0A9X1STE4_9ACTN|nr:ABC transporter substrate-binding protein [Kineosporia babensis]MCD5311784.1 ABC transporter substrate-binding protein [Kineosporia babensis]
MSAFRLVGLTVVAGLVLTACGSGGEDAASTDGKVEITFMHAMSGGAHKPALEAATERFEAASPDITVNLLEQPDYSTLNTKLQSQVAAGDSPTLSQVNPNWTVALADSEVIVPLDERIATSSTYESFYQGIKDDMKLVDGKNWMWPFNKSMYVQYYNTDMVKDAPATWDDLESTLVDVSKDGVVGLSTDVGGATGIAGGSEMVGIIANSNGGSLFDAEGKPTFDDPKVVEALNSFVELQEKGALAVGKNYPGQQALGAEKGAFDLSTVAALEYNLAAIDGKFEMGVAPLPEGTEGASNLISGTNIAMFADTTEAEQDAAWQYLEFLASPEEMAEWASATGYLPISSEATEQPAYQEFVKENAWATDVVAQLDTATRPTPREWTQDSLNIFATAVSNALSGSANAADALAEAQKNATALVK